jgi:hypothetical protein
MKALAVNKRLRQCESHLGVVRELGWLPPKTTATAHFSDARKHWFRIGGAIKTGLLKLERGAKCVSNSRSNEGTQGVLRFDFGHFLACSQVVSGVISSLWMMATDRRPALQTIPIAVSLPTDCSNLFAQAFGFFCWVTPRGWQR